MACILLAVIVILRMGFLVLPSSSLRGSPFFFFTYRHIFKKWQTTHFLHIGLYLPP